MVDGNGRRFSDYEIAPYRCPSYSGSTIIDNLVLYPDALGYPTVGNYIALVASHGARNEWGTPLLPDSNDPINISGDGVGNAIIGDMFLEKDLSAQSVEDGLSKTIMISESREEEYASWYAGGGSAFFHLKFSGYMSPELSENPFLGSDGYVAANQTSLNVSPYFSWPDFEAFVPTCTWGPSSEHAGGVVNHVFADGHVISISETADPTTYLRFITYKGGEQKNEEALQ